MSAHRSYSFGDYTLDLRRGTLLKGGADVRLRPKSFEVLRYLIERHGQLVTKQELLDGVWGHVVVTEGSVTQCLIDVRRAIGDESQQVIRTVPRRGYIFDAPVVELAGVAVSPVPFEPAPFEPVTAEMVPAEAVPVVAAEAAAGPAALRRPYWAIALAIAAVVLLLIVAGPRTREPETGNERAPGTTPVKSIAVLPFVDMSEAQDQRYLSDGVTEEILDRLAKEGQLRVIARTSSFLFRDQPVDIPLVAEKLKVTHVLEGSVRRSGDRVRVTAQLVEASSNSHVWSETYDRSLGDLFAVQSEIANAVVAALQDRIATDATPGLPSATAPAHERALRGRYFANRGAAGDLELALKYFEEAVALDPAYAGAWADLAGVYARLAWEAEDGTDWWAKWRDAAQRAVDLDPNLALARSRLGSYYYSVGDRQRAREQFVVLASLDPNGSWLDFFDRQFAGAGRADLARAVDAQRRLVDRDPLSAVGRINFGILLFAAGHFDQALSEFRQAQELNPELEWDHAIEITRVLVAQRRYDEAYAEAMKLPEGEARDLGFALLHDAPGRRPEADSALARLVARPGDFMHDLRVAELHVLRGSHDEAFDWLQRARNGLEPDRHRLVRIWTLQNEMHNSPFLHPLHTDPRWTALMAVPD